MPTVLSRMAMQLKKTAWIIPVGDAANLLI